MFKKNYLLTFCIRREGNIIKFIKIKIHCWLDIEKIPKSYYVLKRVGLQTAMWYAVLNIKLQQPNSIEESTLQRIETKEVHTIIKVGYDNKRFYR